MACGKSHIKGPPFDKRKKEHHEEDSHNKQATNCQSYTKEKISDRVAFY